MKRTGRLRDAIPRTWSSHHSSSLRQGLRDRETEGRGPPLDSTASRSTGLSNSERWNHLTQVHALCLCCDRGRRTRQGGFSNRLAEPHTVKATPCYQGKEASRMRVASPHHLTIRSSLFLIDRECFPCPAQSKGTPLSMAFISAKRPHTVGESF